MLPDPNREPTVSVGRSASILGISRSSAYAAVRSGEIPSVRIGHRVVVPTVRLLKLLEGVDATAAREGAGGTGSSTSTSNDTEAP